MTTLQAYIAVSITCVLGLIAQHVSYRREMRKHGHAEYERGWCEGWDDREHDHHPETPEPKGRHHGLSQPEDWTATDLIEFLPPVDGTKLVNCKTSRDPDNPSVLALPKRTPKARP